MTSKGGAIAVNVWFESDVSRVVLNSHMSDFYLTSLLQSKVAEKAQQMLDAVDPHPQLGSDVSPAIGK